MNLGSCRGCSLGYFYGSCYIKAGLGSYREYWYGSCVDVGYGPCYIRVGLGSYPEYRHGSCVDAGFCHATVFISLRGFAYTVACL